MLSSKTLVEDYAHEVDWRVKESASAPFSYGAQGRYILSEVQKDYWLREVYTSEIVEAYREGSIHIHDLGGLTLYCCGYSLKLILLWGVKGVVNIPTSAPAKHFGALINQIANMTTIFQNEIMGAVAFSSVDTLFAPFIKEDRLTYEEVKQHVQNLVFSINSNSRAGAEPAFSNITLDITPPQDLLDEKVIVGGQFLDYTYKDCQLEMDMFNKAFYEVMIEGDAEGKPFAYPIPTYNIHKRFDWENENNELLWEMTGKYGVPYFANFGPHSDMDPSDARSMCCRLRLDKRELLRRSGGLFGAGDSTGSIGVVTINLPRLGYCAKTKSQFFADLEYFMDIAKDSLEIKRTYLDDEVLSRNMLPAFSTYVGTMRNHFSTIGYVGLNELCLNLLGCDIVDPRGRAFGLDVLEFMREKLKEYQEETGNLYNLEATPAESTCYRLALKDRKLFPGIITQGTDEAPYYTNSCHMPASSMHTINQIVSHQEELQALHTGGTVIHLFLDGPISPGKAKSIIKQIVESSAAPYISISPVNCFCPEHGMLEATYFNCPHCGTKTDMYQRITGYRRPVDLFNPGKLSEFKDRVQMKVEYRD